MNALQIAPESICDIGCGTGLAVARVGQALAGTPRLVGFEPSVDAPVHPEAQGVVDIRREDAALTNDRFDLALMLDVFEHVDDYLGFLESVRHLASWFAFHIPLDASALGVLKSGLIESREAVGHLHYFTSKTALATLERAGYRSVHHHFTPSAWGGPDRRPNTPLNLSRRALFRISPEAVSRTLGGVSLLVIAEGERS